ncbi:hypothetical protein ACET3Z_027403 [Daucus carota]
MVHNLKPRLKLHKPKHRTGPLPIPQQKVLDTNWDVVHSRLQSAKSIDELGMFRGTPQSLKYTERIKQNIKLGKLQNQSSM